MRWDRETLWQRGLLAAATTGWVALAWSIAPWDVGWNDFDMGRFGMTVGPTCSVVLALRRMTLPVVEVYEAGRRCGRGEAGAVPRGRHLRAVDD